MNPSTNKETSPIPVQSNPYNAETPMHLLAKPITPTAGFYVRNHYGMPELDAKAFRLVVQGLVRETLSLSLEDLKQMPQRRASITMECAGNGRSSLDPRPAGVPWRFGAVGTAEFVGTPLRSVLELAGMADRAVDVVLCGAERGPAGSANGETYERSLSRAHALLDDVLLAWEMNGEPLTVAHGFPLRAVVPRWYAMSSVKWLTRIEVIGEPFDGFWQTSQYLYVNEPGTAERTPVSHMRVRSVIAHPADGQRVAREPMEIAGSAWSGEGKIIRVDVSTDGGASWSSAGLMEQAGPWAATPWRFEWTPPRSGSYALMARATDSAGNIQPMEPRKNAMGYGNNGVHRVFVDVA